MMCFHLTFLETLAARYPNVKSGDKMTAYIGVLIGGIPVPLSYEVAKSLKIIFDKGGVIKTKRRAFASSGCHQS